MGSDEKIGVAIVGAASSIGRHAYLPAVINNSLLEFRVGIDINTTGLAELAQQTGCLTTTDFDTGLQLGNCDIIIISSPDIFHCEQTIKAAEAGKHIICTKPIALNMAEARKMYDAVKANGVKFMCGMNMRYSAVIQALKQQITDGVIGDPVYVEWITRGSFFEYPQEHFYRTAASGGQILHNGAHYLDIMSYLVESLPSSVAGIAAHNIPDNEIMEPANYHNLSIEYESGVFGRLEYNQLLVNPRGYSTAETVTVTGTVGMIELSYDNIRGLEVYSNGKISYPALRASDNSGFNLMMYEFSQSIKDDRPSPLPIEDSLRIFAVCLEASGKNHSLWSKQQLIAEEE
ncbi:MAG: Gfo/Idh/MocA family oxidoreductase [Victivallaceae bacterium]|nr:Gfo/Idh/MocA family oxidoreductase [Victivallaceae bacterium]